MPTVILSSLLFFFFNDTATTEIYPLSLHDALPICGHHHELLRVRQRRIAVAVAGGQADALRPRRAGMRARVRLVPLAQRSEEHTSELQSRQYLVCRLLLEKKKKNIEQSRLLHSRFT